MRALKLRYRKEAAAADAKDKAMYQRAFQKLARLPDTDPKPEPQSHPIDSASLSICLVQKSDACKRYGFVFTR